MHEIRLPKLNNNDGSYTLVEWYLDDGDPVTAGAVVALVETSKTIEELVAPADGVVHHAVAAMAERTYGEVVGYIFPTEAQRQRFASDHPPVHGAAPEDDLVITQPALAAMRRLGIDQASLRALGRNVIRRADVEALASGAPAPVAGADSPAGTRHPLPRRQRLVADVVSRSHASIPAAFTAMWVDATLASGVRGEVRASTGRVIGLPELLIKAIAAARPGYPLFFGALQDDHTVLVPDGAQIGITIDVGHGLYLPVLSDAGARSVIEVADALAGFQDKARRGAFRDEELSGANIGLSLGTYTDVLVVVPIVFPGTSCMLSISGTHREPAPPGAGTRARFCLGLSYDHRVVNGRDAVMFLREIKSTFERPGRLSALAG